MVAEVETSVPVACYQVDAHFEPMLDGCSTAKSFIIAASSDIKDGSRRHSTVGALDIEAISTLMHAFHSHS